MFKSTQSPERSQYWSFILKACQRNTPPLQQIPLLSAGSLARWLRKSRTARPSVACSVFLFKVCFLRSPGRALGSMQDAEWSEHSLRTRSEELLPRAGLATPAHGPRWSPRAQTLDGPVLEPHLKKQSTQWESPTHRPELSIALRVPETKSTRLWNRCFKAAWKLNL